jgi:hypothetical protein
MFGDLHNDCSDITKLKALVLWLCSCGNPFSLVRQSGQAVGCQLQLHQSKQFQARPACDGACTTALICSSTATVTATARPSFYRNTHRHLLYHTAINQQCTIAHSRLPSGDAALSLPIPWLSTAASSSAYRDKANRSTPSTPTPPNNQHIRNAFLRKSYILSPA